MLWEGEGSLLTEEPPLDDDDDEVEEEEKEEEPLDEGESGVESRRACDVFAQAASFEISTQVSPFFFRNLPP